MVKKEASMFTAEEEEAFRTELKAQEERLSRTQKQKSAVESEIAYKNAFISDLNREIARVSLTLIALHRLYKEGK